MTIVWKEAALGDDAMEKLGPRWGRSPLEKQLLMHSSQRETKTKTQLLRREREKALRFFFFK